jgi:2-polyprenyl-6-methoxyphenol hydroxylase-like FAD-dependent oxidoreductase
MLRLDIVVIGAGPAGCCLALRLAELGHAVALVERRAFPRQHVGIALSPGVAPLLDHLGLADIPQSVPHRRFAGRWVDWAGGGRQFRAEETRSQGFTVDRGAFDAALAGAARARGAIVFQPARLEGIERAPQAGPSRSRPKPGPSV